jgi:DME family drug/metabolite transporter
MKSRQAIGYGWGVALAISGAACWSLGGALVRLTANIDAWQIIFYRSLTLLSCMLIWLTVSHGATIFRRIAEAGTNAVIAGIACGIAGLTFLASLFYTTVAQSIFMVGLSPFLSAIIGYWILREKIAGITWIAMSVALGGMAIMLIGNLSGGSLIGTGLAIYSAFCFSCYSVLLRWGQRTDMSVALIWNAIFLIVVSAIVLLAPAGLRPATGLDQLNIGLANLAICIVMGAIQLTLGLVLFTLASRSVPAAQLSLLALVEPTLSPLWAWLVASELPPLFTFIGGAVILFAIAVQAMSGVRRRKPAYIYEAG